MFLYWVGESMHVFISFVRSIGHGCESNLLRKYFIGMQKVASLSRTILVSREDNFHRYVWSWTLLEWEYIKWIRGFELLSVFKGVMSFYVFLSHRSFGSWHLW